MILEELSGPRPIDREAIKREGEKLRQAVINGEIKNKVLSQIIRKELNGNNSDYDGEWSLSEKQYISNIFNSMDLSMGVNLINSSVGTGKTTQFIETPTDEERQKGKVPHAKEGYIVLVPLTSIRLSFEGDNDVFKTGICT
ncbi:hypothetical protein DN619_34975, partial [Klebsiella michiganensis]|uniref:hypothetical protein n=1 Tax=Klebsiella michiganensis TaxID=1134687 RepID=UPI001007D189